MVHIGAVMTNSRSMSTWYIEAAGTAVIAEVAGMSSATLHDSGWCRRSLAAVVKTSDTMSERDKMNVKGTFDKAAEIKRP